MTGVLSIAELPLDELSFAEQLALNPTDADAYTKNLTDEAARAVLYDWFLWCRPDQRPPDWDWRVWLLLQGRGAGKTRTGSESVRGLVADLPGDGCFLGATSADVRDLMVEGPSGILNCCPPGDKPEWQPSKRLLTWPSGRRAYCRSAEDPDGVRGLNLAWAWCDEMAKWRYLKETWSNLRFAMRDGVNPKTIITTTPKPLPLIREIVKGRYPGTYVAPRVSTYRNAANLATEFLHEMRELHEGTRLGRQELHAEILEDIEGALWTWAMIEDCRFDGDWAPNEVGLVVPVIAELLRVVVGVDPPGGTVTECGIVGTGLGKDRRGYVLGDYSRAGTPGQWGQAVVCCYHDLKADAVIAEGNYGLEMVRHVINTVPATTVNGVDYPPGSSIPVKMVNARRGKAVRAEPVVGLYEQHRIVHVGTFGDLETEQTSWVPDPPPGSPPQDSPNRLDALVWGFTHLMVDARDTSALLSVSPGGVTSPSYWKQGG